MTSALQREVIRCPHCELNQFMTASTLCRRCHKGLLPEEQPQPSPVPLVVVRAPAGDLGYIGVAIHGLRLSLHLTQQQLADRMCVPRTYVSKLERGRAIPTVASLYRLAMALGTTVPTLLCGPGDPFIVEIAPYVSQLSDEQRSVILNSIRQLATAK